MSDNYCWKCGRDHHPVVACPTHINCAVCGHRVNVWEEFNYVDKDTNRSVRGLCFYCATHYKSVVHKPSALSRIFSGPVLGVLAGLGLVMIIFVATICRIVLAILSDWSHSLKTTKEKGLKNGSI